MLLCGGGVLAVAGAQEIPSAVEPGQIEERFDDRARTRDVTAPEIAVPEAPVAPVPVEERAFLLSGVVIEGATVYDESEFTPLYEELLAREVTLSDVRAVAAKITDLYQQGGYVLSQAVVPEQDLGRGIVTIRVIEGYVREVLIEGEIEGPESLLTAYGNRITAQRPAHISTLERYVLLTEDLSGVSVRPLLAPVNTDLGEYKLVLVITHTGVQGFVQADNRGSRFVGPIQLWAGATFNSVFGLYENTRVRVVTTPQTEELAFFDLSHTEPVGSEGTTVTVAASYSMSEPGFTLKPEEIESQSTRFELRVNHPVIRSRQLDFYVTGRFTVRDSERDRRKVESVNDQLRVIRLGSVVSFDDALEGRNWLSAEISQGLDIFGASESDSPTLSRPGASEEFTKVTLDASRYQRIGTRWGVLVSATGQKASGTVLGSEEIGLGGERFGRAYDPSEITGPDGAAARVELQLDGRLADMPIRQYQFYGYYDYGAVWTEGDEGRETLSSAGLGVRAQLVYGLFAYVEFAQPLTRSVFARGGDGKDPRYFFTLRANFP